MTINLTAIFITAIICFTFCYVGKNSESKKKEEKKEQQEQQAAGENMIEIPHFVNHTKSKQAQHLAERMWENGEKKGES